MEDKDILLQLMDALGVKSVNAFSKEVGYSSPSALYLVLSGDRPITDFLIRKIRDRYPNVSEIYLRGKSEEIFDEPMQVSSSSTYTLNDLPLIMLEVLKELKKTNELLVRNLNK